jgi:hypothetical protein
MANKKHLKILKSGVEKWNAWRIKHDDEPALHSAHLCYKDLRGANLALSDLTDADLSHAYLHGANLRFANLYAADLSGADLGGANLAGAHFKSTNLLGANFRGAEVGDANFSNVDLREVKGLERLFHFTASDISIGTLYSSGGQIPESFLRGCGVPESFITQIPSLVAAAEPIQFYSCFISYSSEDVELAQRLHADLQSKGVRCWFAPKDLKIGERFRQRIDEVIRIYDRLLLILSEHSVASS